MPMGIEIDLGFGAQDGNCVTRFGMFAHVGANPNRFQKRIVGIDQSTCLIWRSLEEDFFVQQDWDAQSDGKKEEWDESNQNCPTLQNLRKFADCRASKERCCRQNKDEVMRPKIKSRAHRQR